MIPKTPDGSDSGEGEHGPGEQDRADNRDPAAARGRHRCDERSFGRSRTPGGEKRNQEPGHHAGERAGRDNDRREPHGLSHCRAADPGQRNPSRPDSRDFIPWKLILLGLVRDGPARLAANRPAHRGAPGRHRPAQHHLLRFPRLAGAEINALAEAHLARRRRAAAIPMPLGRRSNAALPSRTSQA